MPKVGLTGGIGSGKTTVAGLLARLGYRVYIADRRASRLMNTDPQIRQELCDCFNTDLYTAGGGQLDKKKLAGLIFAQPEALAAVNRIVHPRVLDDFVQWCGPENGEIIFLESAILFESGFDQGMDYIISVYAPENLRIKRVMNRDGLPAAAVRKRIANQMSDLEKRRKADFVISTAEGRMLLPQVLKVLKKIKQS